ncbi:MAG: glucokinase [Parcubacteria group bacterium Athens0416_74]|nr:MAG: glucokinase [Parcubacteria group bacterium Athens0416_74]
MHIVFDIGGTNMRVAPVLGESIGEVRKVRTPKDPSEGIKTFVTLASECAQGEAIESITGCVAGMVVNGVISDAGNLKGWEGTDIVKELSNSLGVQADVVNDAALAGLGEAYVGAGRGAKTLVYVTVSTGVGGALIRDGHIVEAGGVGSIKIGDSDLEGLVSGTAVRAKFGIDPRDLDSVEVRDGLADTLAGGLRQVVARWSPETIVLGGSMIVGINPIPIKRVEETLSKLLAGGAPTPHIKIAELADNGGLWGGVARLTQLRSSSGTA